MEDGWATRLTTKKDGRYFLNPYGEMKITELLYKLEYVI